MIPSCKPNIITAKVNDITITTDENNIYTTLSLIKESCVGNKLTISDGKIKIGTGVKHIKVSATATLINSSNSATYQSIAAYKNTIMVHRADERNDLNYMSNLVMPPKLIPVNENDLISFQEFNRLAGSTSISYAYMTVEVID